MGYLSFDEEKSEVFIPNQEIAREFMRSVKAGGWADSGSGAFRGAASKHLGTAFREGLCGCSVSAKKECGSASSSSRT